MKVMLWETGGGVVGTDKKIMTTLATAALKPELSTQMVRTVVLWRRLTEEPGLDVKSSQGRPPGEGASELRSEGPEQWKGSCHKDPPLFSLQRWDDPLTLSSVTPAL